MATADALLKPDHGASRKHFIFTEEHDQLRESIRSFVTKELAPHAEHVRIADATHMVVGDANDPFTGAVSDFLARHVPTRSSLHE